MDQYKQIGNLHNIEKMFTEHSKASCFDYKLILFLAVLWIRISIHFGRLGPDPDLEEQKWPLKEKKFQVLKCWVFSFEDKDFSWCLGVLYRCLGISKLQLRSLIKKYNSFFSFLVIKTLDPYQVSSIETNACAQHWFWANFCHFSIFWIFVFCKKA